MTHPRLTASATAMLAVVFGLAWSSPAPAQSYAQSDQPAAAEQSFNQKDLMAYARATMAVQDIRRSYQMKLQSAESPDQQMDLQREATDRMVAAVRGEGISVDKYNSINSAAQLDPELNKQIKTYIREAQ